MINMTNRLTTEYYSSLVFLEICLNAVFVKLVFILMKWRYLSDTLSDYTTPKIFLLLHRLYHMLCYM